MEEPEIISQGVLPEVTPQEILPEDGQPERPVRTQDRYIIEMLMRMEESINKKIEEASRSTKEDLKSINQKLDAMNKKMDEDIVENRKSIEKLRREREQRELSLIHI